MTKDDGTGGIGYVVAGYLDSEGPHGITVFGDPDTGQPYPTVEALQKWVDENGGPLDNATIIVGVVLPVGLITHPDISDAGLEARANEVEDEFGPFYASGDINSEYEALLNGEDEAVSA
jgi:hypothetical protein